MVKKTRTRTRRGKKRKVNFFKKTKNNTLKNLKKINTKLMQKINLLNLFKKTQKRKHRGGG